MAIRNHLDYDYVVTSLMNRTPYSEIAERESVRLSTFVSRSTIAGVHRDLKSGKIKVTDVVRSNNLYLPSLSSLTYRYGIDEYRPGAIPVFDGHLQLEEDKALVISDIHGTKLDKSFIMRTELVRRYYGLDTIIIAGDLLDNEAINKHKKLSMRFEANLKTEITLLKELLDWFASNYKRLYIMPGNHDLWLLDTVEGAFDFEDAVNMIANSKAQQKMVVTNYDRLTLYSGLDDTWTISHPMGYNPAPLTVAQKLSEQFETSIIMPHQHISAGPIASRNGKHVLIDIGGVHNPALFAYSNLRTRAGGRTMNSGFASIVEGVGRLWTPDDRVTNWSQLL